MLNYFKTKSYLDGSRLKSFFRPTKTCTDLQKLGQSSDTRRIVKGGDKSIISLNLNHTFESSDGRSGTTSDKL